MDKQASTCPEQAKTQKNTKITPEMKKSKNSKTSKPGVISKLSPKVQPMKWDDSEDEVNESSDEI